MPRADESGEECDDEDADPGTFCVSLLRAVQALGDQIHRHGASNGCEKDLSQDLDSAPRWSQDGPGGLGVNECHTWIIRAVKIHFKVLGLAFLKSLLFSAFRLRKRAGGQLTPELSQRAAVEAQSILKNSQGIPAVVSRSCPGGNRRSL